MESEYIQLPPLPLDTPTKCIELFWGFVHLPRQEQEKVREFLVESLKEDDKKLKETEFIKEVKNSESEVSPEVQEFIELMRKMIGELVAESCEMTALVYKNYCIEKKSIEEIAEEFHIDQKSVKLMTQYYDKKMKA